MIFFGQPLIWINPNAQNLATNPTPMTPLSGQNFSLDTAVDLKELKGLYQYPDDVAPGDKKITGKFEFGQPDLDLLNQSLLAATRTTGGPQTVWNEPHSIPAATPFTVTTTQSTTFTTDLGVSYAGAPPAGFTQQFQRVPSAPTQGQYSVAAGVYTFSTADEGVAVVISYAYTPASPAGFQIEVNNELMGYGPQCELWVANRYKQTSAGLIPGIKLYAVKFGKTSLPFKRDNYVMQSMDFSAFADASGRVMQLWNPGV